jgi:hypothetical protein
VLATVAIIAFAALLLIIVLRLLWGVVVSGKAVARGVSRVSDIRQSAPVFAERAGWHYAERDISPKYASIVESIGLEIAGTGSTEDTQEVHHVLSGDLKGHHVEIFQYGPPDGTSITVWTVKLRQALPTIGSAGTDDQEIHSADADYAQDMLTPKFWKRLNDNAPLAWRMDKDLLVSWKRDSEYRPDQLMKHAGVLTALIEDISPETWQRYGHATG